MGKPIASCHEAVQSICEESFTLSTQPGIDSQSSYDNLQAKWDKAKSAGLTLDNFLKIKSEIGIITSTKNADGTTKQGKSELQREYLFNAKGLTPAQKGVLDDVLIDDTMHIPQDVPGAYADRDALTLSQMSASAQRTYPAIKKHGMSVSDYQKYYNIAEAAGKQEERIKNLMAAGLPQAQAKALIELINKEQARYKKAKDTAQKNGMAAERFDELFPLTLEGAAQEIGQRLIQAGLTQNQALAFMRIVGV